MLQSSWQTPSTELNIIIPTEDEILATKTLLKVNQAELVSSYKKVTLDTSQSVASDSILDIGVVKISILMIFRFISLSLS